jgi:hypothetical protein
VSGGCQSEPKADTVYWILASLKPENNAYHCVANKDRSGGNQDFYQGVTANATCLHNDYIKDIRTVTCDASISGEIDSECTAVCDAGYQATGGGCETNNFHYELPWKVSRSNPYFSTDGSREGWNCRASKDSESDNDTAYRARGYAVCVQYADDKVVDHEMLTDRSGTAEEETNGIDVLCNTGYDVIGGGCDTLGTRGSNLEWKIVESQPVNNFNNKGWSCVGQKDDGTASFHREIQTDALCVKFK